MSLNFDNYKRDRNIKAILVAVLIGTLAISTGYTIQSSAISSSNVATYNQFGTVQNCNYVIFKDTTTTYAKNCDTGAIDYSGTDASTVIQNAINALTSGRIVLREGTYTLTTGLTINTNYVELSGADEYSTILDTTANIVMVQIGDGSASRQFDKVKNLAIQFRGSFNSTREGIDINRCAQCEIDNIYLTSGATNGAGTAIKIQATSGFTQYTKMSNIYSSGEFTTGLLITGNAASTDNGNTCNACTFVGTSAVGSIGVNVDKGDTNVFTNPSVSNYETGYRIADSNTKLLGPRMETLTTGVSITSGGTNLFIYGPSFATTTTKYNSLQTTTFVTDSTGYVVGGMGYIKRNSGTQIILRNTTDTGNVNLAAGDFQASTFTGNPSATVQAGSSSGTIVDKTYNGGGTLTTRVTISGNANQATMTMASTDIDMGGNSFKTIRSGSADPTTSDIASGYYTLWKNTTTGEIALWYNDGGTLQKVYISSLGSPRATVSDYQLTGNNKFHFPTPFPTIVNNVVTFNNIYAYPFIVTRTMTLGQLGYNVNSGVSGAFGIAGIYNDTGGYYPDKKLVATSEFNNTQTGNHVSSISLQLKPGLYWAVYTCGTGSATIVGYSTAGSAYVLGVSPTSNQGGWKVSRSYDSTLPTAFPGSGSAITANADVAGVFYSISSYP